MKIKIFSERLISNLSSLSSKNKYTNLIIILCLLFILGARTAHKINVKTETYDEKDYLMTGEYLSRTNSWDSVSTIRHPPLSYFTHGIILNKFEFKTLNQRMFWAKSIMIFYTLLLGLAVFKFAKKLYGTGAGFLALTLYSFSPDILAHSGLITTDIIVSCFILISVYFFLDYIRDRSGSKLFLTGVCFGLALLSKYSGVILIFIMIVMWLIGRYIYKKKIGIGSLIFIFLFGILILNLGYGFTGSFKTTSEYKPHLASSSLKTITGILPGIPVPLPYPYVLGFDRQQYFNEIGHPSFLMGKHSLHGWWYYFLAAFLLKSPLPFLLIITGSCILLLFYKSSFDDISIITVILILFAATSFLIRNNAGYRYILPAIPFLCVFSGRILRYKKIFINIPLFLLTFWFILDSTFAHPHYIEYFGELAGGSKNGYKFLVDSNLDWGQNQKSVLKYANEHKLKRIYPPRTPGTGHLIINANNYQDVFRRRKPNAWFHKFKPTGHINYSWLTFNLSVSDYEDLVKNDPGDPYNRYYLASVYFKKGKFNEAIDQLQNAIKIKADFSYAYNLLGKIYLKQNEFFNAEKSFKQAISYDRYYKQAYLNLSRAYKKRGFFPKANAAAKQAIIAGIFDAYFNLPSTSTAYYVNNLKKNPDNARFHNNLGFLYWADGKTDKAINEFNAAISLDPYQADYLSNLAYCYHDKGQNDKALELIKKYDILKRKPEVKKAYSIHYGKDEIQLDTIFVLPILSIKELSRS